jgi:hypothetical protein
MGLGGNISQPLYILIVSIKRMEEFKMFNNGAFGAGVVSAWASMGVEIHKVDEDTVPKGLYISVPEDSATVNKDGIPMAVKQMAKRIHETLKEMGMPMKVHYKIRQGVFWTDDMGKQASDEMLKTIYGRR